jgi:hypothetical protein
MQQNHQKHVGTQKTPHDNKNMQQQQKHTKLVSLSKEQQQTRMDVDDDGINV